MCSRRRLIGRKLEEYRMNRKNFYIIVVSQKYKHTGFICVTKKHLFKLHCYFKRGLLWNRTRLCVGESAEAFTFLFLWHTLMSSTSRDTELSSFSLFCVLSETFYYAVIEEEDRSLQSRKRLERDTATNRETDGDKHEYTDNKTHTRYYGRTIWR